MSEWELINYAVAIAQESPGGWMDVISEVVEAYEEGCYELDKEMA